MDVTVIQYSCFGGCIITAMLGVEQKSHSIRFTQPELIFVFILLQRD